MTHHPSFGSELKWDPAGGTGYSAIGQVHDIKGPNISRGTIDTTDQDDASGDGYRTFLPGIPDGGDITFTIGFDPNNTAHTQGAGTGLIGDFVNDGCTPATFQHTLKLCGGTAIWTFPGFLTGFSPSSPLEGEQTADVSVKIAGKPTLSAS